MHKEADATMDRPITVRQVAEVAGVSPATVSRVLSGSTRVNPELRSRTLQAVERLGYRANRVARALRTRVTNTVGMVVPNIANPFFPVIIQAVEAELHKHGARLLLCDSADDVAQEADLLRSLLDQQIDGILLSPCDRIASRSAVRMAAGQVPLVQIDRVAVRDLHYVGVDQEAAMAAVIAHLADEGCRRFAYVSFSVRASTAAERLRGYVRHVRPLDVESSARVYSGDVSIAWGREAASRILQEGDLPDAVVCADDLAAVGVLESFSSEGVAVPNDVLVTGFDDTILAPALTPSLTSVRQPMEEMGREAVQMVRTAARGGPPPRPRLFPAELVIRESSRRALAATRRTLPPYSPRDRSPRSASRPAR